MEYDTTISPSLTELVTPLRRLHSEGGEGNFLVLSLEQGRNYYVQAGADRGGDSLRLEAVSNDFLEAPHELEDAQVARLDSLGWNDPDTDAPNFSRVVDAQDDAGYGAAAQLLLACLMEVYGMEREAQVHVEIHLE